MKNNDLISRTALLEIVGSMSTAWEYGQAVTDIYKIIKEQPAVDAAPVVHGRWEVCGDDYLVCSVCGARYYKGWLLQSYCTGPGSDQMDGFLYCPHCMALLDGGETH